MMRSRDVDWGIRRRGRAWVKNALERWELTPRKIEMVSGKLFYNDEQRLMMLGMLLENLGVDAAVRMGDPNIWREAIEALPKR